MFMAVNWHRLRMGPSDMYLTREASFKDTLFIGMHEGEPHPVLQDRVSGCIFSRCNHRGCFPILHVRKIYFKGLFLMFWGSMFRTGCYVKQMKSIQFFNLSTVMYVIAQVNYNTIDNICWLIQTFNYQCYGLQVHFKSILMYNLKAKRDVWSNCPHYIMGYIINLGSMFFRFHWFWIWHVSIIHCAKFEVNTCSICDVVTIPITAFSSLFKMQCC